MRKILLLASVAGVALSAPAFAQDDAAAAPEEEATEIIVTGTPGGSELRKQDASFAITSVSADDLATAAPKSTAEVFTLVPGVWAESSGGKAGANIDVRGLPGGGDAPFVTLAVAGAPIYGTPSLSFFEQSSIFRTDETIASVEALRGGPNAVFGRGEPGVTLNFRLKEGHDDTEGRVKFSTSDYGLLQADGVVSGKLAENLYYMVGGYWSQSHGIRDAQFNSEHGWQLTGQLTYRADNAKVNIWTRQTDDFGQWYLPMSLVSGNDLGTFSQLGDATRFRTLRINGAGDTKTFDFKNGRGWKGNISGLNADVDLTDNLTLRNNLAYTKGSADTYGLVPDGAPVRVSALPANGTRPAGTASTLGGTALAGTEFVQNYGHWVVQKDLKSFTNDFSVALKTGSNELTVGWYSSSFSSKDFWTLGNFTPLHNVQNGDFLAANVTCADLQTAGSGSGCWGYGIDAKGDAEVNALYLADSLEVTDKLRLDAGVRREWIKLDYLLDSGPGYPDGTRDMNVELKDSDWAYTFAANYAFTDDLGVFARYSDGFVFPNFDDIRENNLNVNGIRQLELGLKYSSDHFNLFATGFRNTNDSFESDVGGIIPPTSFKTRSTGVELDGRVRYGGFNLGFIATYQNAKVTESPTTAIIGNRVLRQPKFTARLTPSYDVNLGDWRLNLYSAASFVGSRFSDLANTVKLKGYTKVDLGMKIESPWGFFGQIHADNLFDSHGLTEGDPRSTTAANGRPILGRSIRFSVGYDF
ncbi:MAG: TonB-dependent receptor [Sphingomonadaceae bacterium]|nr:TonB-dependent receptor [Sphingomonadaceae bacterium]